ncbi:MAG: hypothetical protein QGF90_06855 [Gammaproteobacteria bacterium]|nr:hypothetical protein [Gammaproteobacteria bacterium]
MTEPLWRTGKMIAVMANRIRASNVLRIHKEILASGILIPPISHYTRQWLH